MVLEDKLGTEEYAVASGINAKKLIHEIDTNLTLLKESKKASHEPKNRANFMSINRH